jgi:hypothetical protein
MAKRIKYLDYTVSQGGTVISSGRVPAILALGGSAKNYDLADIWVSGSNDNELSLTDGATTFKVSSGRERVELAAFAEKINSGEINDSL